MTSTHTILARAVRHLAIDPQVVAAALTAYRARMGIGEAALAAWLGTSVERLHGLALCARPDPADPRYTAEVEAIARYIGGDTNRLHLVPTSA